jgi:hypothetical protein
MTQNILAQIIAIAFAAPMIYLVDRLMIGDAPSTVAGLEPLVVGLVVVAWLKNEILDTMRFIGQWLKLLPGDPERPSLDPDQVYLLLWVCCNLCSSRRPKPDYFRSWRRHLGLPDRSLVIILGLSRYHSISVAGPLLH